MNTSPASTEQIPTFPRITAAFREDDTVEVQLLGVSRTFEHHHDQPSPRVQALEYIHGVASSEDFGRPVRVQTTTPGGVHVELVVTPGGTFWDATDPDDVRTLSELQEATNHVEPAAPDAPSLLERLTGPEPVDEDLPPVARGHTPAPDLPGHAAPSFASAPTPVTPPAPPALPETAPGRRAAATPAPVAITPAVDRPGRHSFIRTEVAVRPAEQGWRAGLNQMGMRLAPGAAELAFRSDVDGVSEHWPGPRTVAIANGKGSANKTPTTVMLAAVFARYGGAGVLAWDNNETRGSLAWRTQRATHDATVLDLLPRVDDLLATTAQSAEMSHFTHHQPADKFDVLHSDQSVEGDHEVSSLDVEEVHRVASRYYRMILMDSGNNERATNWRSMIERANALVMPCTNVEDTPEAGSLMLDALASRDEHSADLARNAVAIVSQRTPGKDPNMARIVDGLTPLVREVVTIPFDPALVSGVIRFDALKPNTQRAWLRAAAAVARSL